MASLLSQCRLPRGHSRGSFLLLLLKSLFFNPISQPVLVVETEPHVWVLSRQSGEAAPGGASSSPRIHSHPGHLTVIPGHSELPNHPKCHSLTPLLASPQLHPPGVFQIKPNSQPSDPGGSSDAPPDWTPPVVPTARGSPHGTDPPSQFQAALQPQPCSN